MPRRLSQQSKESDIPKEHYEHDSDPEPPAAPPVIILANAGSRKGKASRNQAQGPEPRPLTSPSEHKSPVISRRYSLRKYGNKLPRDSPKPDPGPVPDPAPPIIILSRKRLASSSPTRSSATPPPTFSPQHHSTMGSKSSKISENHNRGKLQPSQRKADKEEMKEPSNYYAHRSKSMRRKAGRDTAGAATGQASSGGLA
ncbi:hypothetical protein B0J11DRAFT_50726 [Dendryphion nanum]|uniref:Uncharacterized protein n=1 Tax=Dendryphion nanum TaxID=256645 RepID=A0A9P9IIT5_9PLEO|nr:hypothetical protein B0J11DRAFT_50726 [Dendryphion nanum]